MRGSFRFTYKKDCWWLLLSWYWVRRLFCLMFIHLLLIIFDDIEEISWVKPSYWEKIVLSFLWEFFSKTTQVYTQSIFARNIVHSQEVVDALPRLKCAQPFRSQATIIKPVYIPRSIISLALIIIIFHRHLTIILSICYRISSTTSIVIVVIRWSLWWLLFTLNCLGIAWEESLPAEKLLCYTSENVISTLYRQYKINEFNTS